MEFADVVAEWEAHDDWQYADRSAQRKYFYIAGLRAAAEIAAREMKRHEFHGRLMTADGCEGVHLAILQKADAIETKAEGRNAE